MCCCGEGGGCGGEWRRNRETEEEKTALLIPGTHSLDANLTCESDGCLPPSMCACGMISAVGQPLQAKESGSLPKSHLTPADIANSAAVIGVFCTSMFHSHRIAEEPRPDAYSVWIVHAYCGSCGKGEKLGSGVSTIPVKPAG